MSKDEKVIGTVFNDNSQKDEKIEITAEIVADDLKNKTLEVEWTAPFVDCDWRENDFVLAIPKVKNLKIHIDVDNPDAIEYFDDYKNSNGKFFHNYWFGQILPKKRARFRVPWITKNSEESIDFENEYAGVEKAFHMEVAVKKKIFTKRRLFIMIGILCFVEAIVLAVILIAKYTCLIYECPISWVRPTLK